MHPYVCRSGDVEAYLLRKREQHFIFDDLRFKPGLAKFLSDIFCSLAVLWGTRDVGRLRQNAQMFLCQLRVRRLIELSIDLRLAREVAKPEHLIVSAASRPLHESGENQDSKYGQARPKATHSRQAKAPARSLENPRD